MRRCGIGLLGFPLLALWNRGKNNPFISSNFGAPYQGTDDHFLDEIQRAAFDFFWNEASPSTGQVEDRALANGNDLRLMSSIAATGFGLTGLCIAHQRGNGKSAHIVERVRKTLRFILNQMPHQHDCELMMIYLLAIGSSTHPVPADTWQAWSRPKISYQGISYISGNDPLFTHQYSHAWFDFQAKHDAYANYFDNSVKATKAHKLFCLSLHDRFPDYSDDLWGITASDYVHGYTAWGGPPPQGPIDGTVVPCATGGSLPFLFDDCMRVLRTIRSRYGNKTWQRYGFIGAFNPLTNWYDPDVLGIDLGITMLMAENHRTGFVWQTFMKNPEAKAAMQKAGFQSD